MGYIFEAMNRADATPAPGSAPGSGPGSEAPDRAAGSASSGAAGAEEHERGYVADAMANDPEERKSVPEPADEAPAPLALSAAQRKRFDDRLVTLTEPTSAMAEEYRAMRTSLLARWQHRRNLVHTLTSATPQEGKTLTSLNLGLAFAELRNRRTIVVETDLRLPTFGKLMPLAKGPGLIGYLRGEASLSDVTQMIEGQRLSVIAAGGYANDDAVQLLSSPAMPKLLDALRGAYDHVIMDTPPVLELADAGILGALSDDVLLLVRMNRTPRPLIDQALRKLASYHAPATCVIATDQPRLRHRYYAYRYGGRYGDQRAA